MKRHDGADETVAFALATGSTVAAAARKAGISERTVYKLLTNPEYKKRIKQIRSEILERAASEIVNIMTCAVGTFRKLLSSDSDTVKLGAARSIMEYGTKLHETVDLEGRLSELEAGESSNPNQATGK